MAKYKIPTILGILILLVSLGVGVWLVKSERLALFPKAAAEFTPKQVRVASVTESGFTVSWVTDEATVGLLKLGKTADKLDQVWGDDRDQKSGTVGSSETHYMTVKNLQPTTSYWFSLGSGPGRVMYDNQGKPYQVTTAGVVATKPAADTAYGTVVDASGRPAGGAIVYVQLPGAVPLSSLVQDNGNWAVAVATARTSDLKSYAVYDAQTTQVEILVQAGSRGSATATVATGNDAPVPAITLGKNLDFRVAQTSGSGTPAERGQSPAGPASSQFSVMPVSPATETAAVTLMNPAQDNTVVTATQPAFKGKGPAGEKLTITVNSPTTYTGTVTVKPDGNWDWTPPAGLEPGTHTITISFLDDQGVTQTLKRTFVVAAAGPAVGGVPSFTASPSATATPTATPRVSLPSTASGVPTSGVATPTLIMLMLGGGLLTLGVFWQMRYQL